MVSLIKGHPRLADLGVTVTAELQAANADMCPLVLVSLDRITATPIHLVAGYTSGGEPDEEHLYVSLECWAFSAQGVADAARQRDRLVQAVKQTIRSNWQLDGRMKYWILESIAFPPPKEAAFASAVLQTRMYQFS